MVSLVLAASVASAPRVLWCWGVGARLGVGVASLVSLDDSPRIKSHPHRTTSGRLAVMEQGNISNVTNVTSTETNVTETVPVREHRVPHRLRLIWVHALLPLAAVLALPHVMSLTAMLLSKVRVASWAAWCITCAYLHSLGRILAACLVGVRALHSRPTRAVAQALSPTPVPSLPADLGTARSSASSEAPEERRCAIRRAR